MAYQRRYRTVVPVPKDEAVAQDQTLIWLTRESFDRKAAADALTIVEFTDQGTVAPEDIPPKVDKQMGKPAADFVWRAFEGVGERSAQGT